MTSYQDFNRQIIEAFRASGGKGTGPFEGAPMVLLHTTGRKTGREFVHPLVYQQIENAIVVFASKGGLPTHPEWYLNLVADPEVTVEVGTEVYAARARVAQGEERERIWSRQKQLMPAFAQYERATTREIPVVIIERR